MKKVIIFGLIISLIIGSCTPHVDFKAEEQVIRSISMKWLELDKSHDAAAISSLFANDAVLVRQDQQPVGQTAIQNYITEFWDKYPKFSGNWSIDRIEIAASGDLAIEYGSWKSSGLGQDGTEDDYGKYITIYRKMDGTWKISYDIGQTTKPEEDSQ